MTKIKSPEIPASAKVSGSDKPAAEVAKEQTAAPPKPKRKATGAAAASAKKKAAAEAERLASQVIFTSRIKEPTQFDVANISPTRDFGTGKLIYVVEEDDVERFERHHHVQSGRIIRANPDK